MAHMTIKREGSVLSETAGVPVLEKGTVADHEIGSSAPSPAFTVPDGGLEAWLVVFGGWLILFSGFGYVNGASPAFCTSGFPLNVRSVWSIRGILH
jgi:hypothetical protein